MGISVRAVYFVYLGFASLVVVIMNLYNLPTWQSIANTVFGTVFPQIPYLQTWALNILLLGFAYLAAFICIRGVKGEGGSAEREKWSDRMSR